MKQSDNVNKKMHFDQSLLGVTLVRDNVLLEDIIPLEQLQSLQDKFSVVNGVSSIILDLNDTPITQPSNFKKLCGSSFYLGEKCIKTDRIVQNINIVRPQCRLTEAKTPIYIGEKHIANWKIGMCGFGSVIGPFLEVACDSIEKYNEIHDRLSDNLKTHFNNVCELLKATAGEISELGYANIRLIAEKERIMSLGDNYPDGCLYSATLNIETTELKLTYLSKTWEGISGGLSIDAALSDINNVFALLFPEDIPVFMGVVMKSAETMTNINVELRFNYKNRETKWVQIASRPHLEGTIVIWDGFILDITERKIAELKLEDYRNSLEQAVKERTEEYEATNEELYATNEELYATNEEFAAINEELHNKNFQLEHEIAARKEAMQKLEDSESKLHNFIMQSSEGIVITNDEGRVIEWNPEQERITEIPREDALGKYSWELYRKLILAEKTDEMTEKYRQLVCWLLNPNNEQKYSNETEHILYSPDKGKQYIKLTSFQIAIGDKYFLGEIVRDTTESKLIELELELYRTQLEEMVVSQTKELLESKERLTTLSDNLPGGAIYQLSAKKGETPQFSYISANFANMFHVAIDDVMGDSALFFNMFHPEDREKVIELFASNHSGFASAECRVCLDTSKILWIHLRSSYREQDDQSRLWDGFMTDITDRKNAEQELEETRRRQSILIKVLQILQSAGNLDEAINTALSEIGQYAGVSRAYIFEKTADGKAADNTYEWCNENITPEIDNLQGVPIEFMSDWFEAFDRDEYICVSDIIELSPTAYKQLSLQNIKSLLVLPLITNNVIYGFVGFDECMEYKQWQKKEVELLISLSQIISTTTTRYRAEKSIQLSQQTMRTVLDNINANIYVADFDTYEVLFANKMVKDQMGEEVEGKLCWKILQNGMTGPCEFCPNPKLLNNERKTTGLYRWEAYNSILDKWFECTDAAIEWIDGRLVHIEYATDITDRRAAQEALRQSEEMYRQLTVASPDAIVVCDTQGKVIFLSPKTIELLNIVNDIKSDDATFERYVHPHDLRKSLELFQSIVEGHGSTRPQILLMREDGSEFFGEITSAAVKDEKGQIMSVIMVIRDITDRRMNEMELIRAKEKAEESDKLKSAFLANMSHEIRTPINGIIGFLNFLADDNLSPKRRRDYISVVNNSSIQLVKLIDDIIDVAKIEAKQLSISPIVFCINEFMNELQVFFDTYLHTNNKDKIALILDDSQFIEPDVIFVDPMRLRQVLTNLIGNAIKFTEKGYIGFGYRPLPPDKLEFWVEDSGIGLPPDQLEVIFERFRQAELTNNRKYGGTGLGLTISRSLVQMMGGDINVESIEGEGSTFRFTITYLPVSLKDKPLLSEKGAEPLPGERSLEGMSVLLVEPGAMMCRYYEKLLASTGATLIRAETVKQWIDTISQPKHIDVVLANACIFRDEYGESLRMVKSVRADLPLVLVIPERNEYYYRVINDSRCNHVIEGTADYAILYNALKKYL